MGPPVYRSDIRPWPVGSAGAAVCPCAPNAGTLSAKKFPRHEILTESQGVPAIPAPALPQGHMVILRTIERNRATFGS
jgi:hypothetical protein